MKKITLLLFLISNIIYSQVLNQPANWPNENWTTSGEYTPVGLIAEPSTSDSFTFDDDAAGNTSLADIIMSESPVIDLTAAFNAGEVFISISGEYSHYDIGGYLGVEYYSADSNNWDYGVLDLQNTTNTVADYQNCENQVDFETVIDISGFTANELANFKYRFYYMDGNGWQWGWCIKSPSIISSSSVDCPNPEFYYWSMGTTMVGFSGSNNATVTYYEIEYNLGETFTPGDGTAESFTFTEFPNTITGLEPDSVYYFTSRSVCSDGSTSEWNDNSFNGDGPDPWSTFAASEDCTDEYDLPIIWSDNFECHESFAIDNIEGWTSIDLEGGQTFWPNDGIYPNAGYVGAGIIWNNAQANFLPAWNPIEGDQGLYFFASGANFTTELNDDWMIGPEFTIDGISSPSLTFLAKSVTGDYGLEKFQIGIGSTTDPDDFTIISAGDYEEAPTVWTQYQYDLSAYEGQTVRVGVHYLGSGFVLQMDSFVVEGTILDVNDIDNLEMNIYPNPVNGNFVTIQTPTNGVKYVEVFDITGKRLINTSLTADSLEVSSLSAGMYLIKVTVEGQSKTSKLVVR